MSEAEKGIKLKKEKKNGKGKYLYIIPFLAFALSESELKMQCYTSSFCPPLKSWMHRSEGHQWQDDL